VSEFDQLADGYDKTRGGESRGEEYAAEILGLLPTTDGPILEIGVGTGVVALGLARRGLRVLGLDISEPMLEKAFFRLGAVLVRSDALRMSVATGSVAHAVSVWVVHSVADPVRLFEETARVLRPGGSYVVCTGQRPAPDDEIGQIITEMAKRVDRKRGAERPRAVSPEQVTGWAARAGFTATVHERERSWISDPGQELEAIALRQWPALRQLDEESVEEVTRPVIEALRALPPGNLTRRATAEMTVLRQS
jgi:ubiquinone/menaquinone biosynthesis C-methylase UbiE